MIILSTKLKNAISKANNGKMDLTFKLKNISINKVKRGCSGFIINNDNGCIIYVTTEGIKWNGEPIQYMYRYAKNDKDYTGYTNRWSVGIENLVKDIIRSLEELPNIYNEPILRKKMDEKI